MGGTIYYGGAMTFSNISVNKTHMGPLYSAYSAPASSQQGGEEWVDTEYDVITASISFYETLGYGEMVYV